MAAGLRTRSESSRGRIFFMDNWRRNLCKFFFPSSESWTPASFFTNMIFCSASLSRSPRATPSLISRAWARALRPRGPSRSMRTRALRSCRGVSWGRGPRAPRLQFSSSESNKLSVLGIVRIGSDQWLTCSGINSAFCGFEG